jgi:hypothetical protein
LGFGQDLATHTFRTRLSDAYVKSYFFPNELRGRARYIGRIGGPYGVHFFEQMLRRIQLDRREDVAVLLLSLRWESIPSDSRRHTSITTALYDQRVCLFGDHASPLILHPNSDLLRVNNYNENLELADSMQWLNVHQRREFFREHLEPSLAILEYLGFQQFIDHGNIFDIVYFTCKLESSFTSAQRVLKFRPSMGIRGDYHYCLRSIYPNRRYIRRAEPGRKGHDGRPE